MPFLHLVATFQFADFLRCLRSAHFEQILYLNLAGLGCKKTWAEVSSKFVVQLIFSFDFLLSFDFIVNPSKTFLAGLFICLLPVHVLTGYFC